jgi:hypothetical protein
MPSSMGIGNAMGQIVLTMVCFDDHVGVKKGKLVLSCFFYIIVVST